MLHPPFRPAALPAAIHRPDTGGTASDRDASLPAAAAPAQDALARRRFSDLDSHTHCSVIGTCLTAVELRKLMRPFMAVDGASDLDVHHEAVRLTSQRPELAKALHKALDRRHEASLNRFGKLRHPDELAGLWQASLRSGDVPGAYWAVLTHRLATPGLRQQAFGDVHMLSHLMGAANRADIRRLQELERENAELREQLDRQQERHGKLVAERADLEAAQTALRLRVAELERAQDGRSAGADAARSDAATTEALRDLLARQSQRRESAEIQATGLAQEVERLSAELAHQRAFTKELGRELNAVESALQAGLAGPSHIPSGLTEALQARHVLYVGRRPSSIHAIRDLVSRHGGFFERHDGGIEDRKGLLTPALSRADVVVFPVDCIAHDSALSLKRQCQRLNKPFVALRSASLASFASAMSDPTGGTGRGDSACGGPCLHHG